MFDWGVGLFPKMKLSFLGDDSSASPCTTLGERLCDYENFRLGTQNFKSNLKIQLINSNNYILKQQQII